MSATRPCLPSCCAGLLTARTQTSVQHAASEHSQLTMVEEPVLSKGRLAANRCYDVATSVSSSSSSMRSSSSIRSSSIGSCTEVLQKRIRTASRNHTEHCFRLKLLQLPIPLMPTRGAT